jgi:hypothetical protein
MKKLKVIDLLEAILEYDIIWDYEEFYHSEPSIARRRQIGSLLNAFNLNVPENYFINKATITENGINVNQRINYFLEGYNYILKGGFFELNNPYPYNDLINVNIEKILQKYYKGFESASDLDCRELPAIYQELLYFKKNVFMLTNNNANNENTNQPLIDFKSKFINTKLKSFTKEIKEVDVFLSWILDPYNRSFTRRKIKFPYYNLEKMDKDFFE